MAVSTCPWRGEPAMVTVPAGAPEATGPTGDELALADPEEFVAVTVERRYLARSPPAGG